MIRIKLNLDCSVEWEGRDATRLVLTDESGKEIKNMAIDVSESRVLSFKAVDSKNREVPNPPYKGDGEWNVDHSGGLQQFPNPGGLSCQHVWQAPMDTLVTVSIDVTDPDGTVRKIKGSDTVKTKPHLAVGLVLIAGPDMDV